MLDENLPAFFLKPASSGIKHHRDFFLSHHGSDPAPAYVLQHADPTSASPNHKNCYAAALFDAWNPDILFGEVLARPEWTQPTLNQEEIRRQGGVPPPPQPILPQEFVVQLYNPEQQVRVELKEGKWGSSDTFVFSMPQDVFRMPSASSLDKGSSDPSSLPTTPKINFVWRKEGKLSKDLTCFMTGRSTDTKKKSNRKDPDIAIGLWRQMRELTIYEPNLSRIDMEDPKGLEVVLLLSAVVIKDLYFSSKDQLRDMFNVSDSPVRKLSAGGRRLSHSKSYAVVADVPPASASYPPPQVPPSQGQPAIRTANDAKRNSLPKLQTPASASTAKPPPMADPRAQWELDAETARLKAEADREQREAARRRREREKADEAEARRLQKLMEAEEREAQRKRAEVDRETERLRRMYGVKPLPQQDARRPQANTSRPQQPPRPVMGSNGLYTQPSASASGVYMSGGAGNPSSLNVPGKQMHKKKSSFFGLRSHSDDGGQQRLSKKSSAMW